MADSDKKGGGAAKKPGTNKAQAELDAFRARQLAGTPANTGPGPVQWAFMAPQAGPGQGWPLPPSVMAMQPPAAPYPGMAMPGYGQSGLGAYGTALGNLGSTLGLGVDMLNTMLAGGLAVLQQIGAGYGYGYAPPQGYAAYGHGGGHHGHGCGCGSGCGCGCDSCHNSCGQDCCCTTGADRCCHPSVGSCC